MFNYYLDEFQQEAFGRKWPNPLTDDDDEYFVGRAVFDEIDKFDLSFT
jgi:hypothetical protein